MHAHVSATQHSDLLRLRARALQRKLISLQFRCPRTVTMGARATPHRMVHVPADKQAGARAAAAEAAAMRGSTGIGAAGARGAAAGAGAGADADHGHSDGGVNPGQDARPDPGTLRGGRSECRELIWMTRLHIITYLTMVTATVMRPSHNRRRA